MVVGALLLGQSATQVVAGPNLMGRVQTVSSVRSSGGGNGVLGSGDGDLNASSAANQPTKVWDWPLRGVNGGPPTIVRPFEAPVHRWDAGHRGLDLAGAEEPGGEPPTAVGTTAADTTAAPAAPLAEPVLAAGAGTVTFAGTLFGRGVVSVGHGALRTTYSPVAPSVRVGDRVLRGQVIGVLEPGHCAGRPCLHWGLLTGRGRRIRYDDPSILLGPGGVRLEPVRSR